MNNFEITIGLEVHVQLATQSKLFCSCSTVVNRQANSQICPVCMGLPGALPVVNHKAIELAIKTALALNCDIAPRTQFARKNYFYPDLPKGYQISQLQLPLAKDGFLPIRTARGEKKIHILQLHVEEDAGKSIHEADKPSCIDLNRCGIALVEIVSAPEIADSEHAYQYLKQLKNLLQYISVSECNMQQGNLRCDANISIAPVNAGVKGVKTEIKNLNSFNNVRRALEYEACRQFSLLQRGEKIVQETMTWNEEKNCTHTMRNKEFLHDYRYFPEPDLPVLAIEKQWVDKINNSLPELPAQRAARMASQYNIDSVDANLLVEDRFQADYFETCAQLFADAREIMNWIKGKIHTYLNERKQEIRQLPISAHQLVELLELIANNTINRSTAKEIFDNMIISGKPAKHFAIDQQKINDPLLIRQLCERVIGEVPQLVAEYRHKPKVLNALIGHVMRASKGRVDIEQAKTILVELCKVIDRK